ncbi:MAG: hypothetical protein IPO67_29525 [Deltaproteobacteria bacterium]|nr:hypothetical protein [Deltaproteobacteria bacterium]
MSTRDAAEAVRLRAEDHLDRGELPLALACVTTPSASTRPTPSPTSPARGAWGPRVTFKA